LSTVSADSNSDYSPGIIKWFLNNESTSKWQVAIKDWIVALYLEISEGDKENQSVMSE
jgi:hypothetical protein